MSTHSSDTVATSAPASSASPSTTAAATTTSSPSPTSSTTNASTPSSSSASTAATSGSSTTTSAQSSSSTTATLQTSQTVVSSGGTVETITQVITPTVTSTSNSQNTSSSNSFFSNTGAVAGVFTVVGLVVIGLAIALIINCVRRRRAQKFDRDVAQAAAEAAASSRSPFEEYSYNNTGGGGGGGGGGYGYSGDSHGTYQLPPMQPNDTYGMSEMSQYDPYAAGAASLAAAAVDRSRSRKESEPGTPGIAGVGARGLAREPSKHAPYHAFAGPSPPAHELQGSSGALRSPRGTNQDVLEAVGLAGPGSGPYPSPTPNPNTNPVNTGHVMRKPSETTQQTHVSGRSQFGSMSGHPGPLQPGYPVIDSYYPQRNDSHSPDPFAGYPPQVMPASTTTLPNPHDATLPSPSIPGHQSDHNEEYGDVGPSTPLRSEEQRMSYQDDTDYSQGNRVLRVANE